MTYSVEIKLDHNYYNMVNNYLSNKVHLGEDETLIKTAHFKNGYEMDIKLCGTHEEDETAWCEAVLFDEKGCEISCSEVEDEYFGKWELKDNNNNIYKVNVIIGG